MGRATFTAALLIVALAQPAAAQTKVGFTCGTFRSEAWSTGSTSHWIITRAAAKDAESTAVLKKGPRFACVARAVLAIEFVAASGQAFLDLRFPDGAKLGYGGQAFEKNGRFVLPIQARARIPTEFRTAFDYHCKVELPGDPIPAASRADCLF
jgi:hypothetical protein